MAEQLNTGGGEFDPCRYRLRLRDCLLGAQMLFVAFGALVLVPLLTGLNSMAWRPGACPAPWGPWSFPACSMCS